MKTYGAISAKGFTMGKGNKRKLQQAFGTGEHRMLALPKKIGNIRLSLIDHVKERGGCSICYPHGPETNNATQKKNTRSWKKQRKTKYRMT